MTLILSKPCWAFVPQYATTPMILPGATLGPTMVITGVCFLLPFFIWLSVLLKTETIVAVLKSPESQTLIKQAIYRETLLNVCWVAALCWISYLLIYVTRGNYEAILMSSLWGPFSFLYLFSVDTSSNLMIVICDILFFVINYFVLKYLLIMVGGDFDSKKLRYAVCAAIIVHTLILGTVFFMVYPIAAMVSMFVLSMGFAGILFVVPIMVVILFCVMRHLMKDKK